MYKEENNRNTENVRPNVILRNEPKLSEHEVDRDLNEMRTSFVPHIQHFIANQDLFKDEEEVGIEFAHKGVGSVIAIIDTPTNKWVLKIPRSKRFSAGEGLFLQAWARAGVTIPQVIDTGELNGSPYTLMQFIDAPTLDVRYSYEELIANGMFTEMGKVLRLMHSEPVSGYGFVVDGKPEFKTVEEWLAGSDMKNRFDYVADLQILEGIEDELTKALDVITEHSKTSSSSYCHDDFGQSNIFATYPITVFDPNPRFNSGYYDLGKIKFFNIAFNGSKTALDQLLNGYFDKETCNDRVLNAYTLLSFVYKCPYWKKTKREKELERVKEY
ncbi:MAG: hypothetical protein RLZZ70_34, partial [Candidatus Parcubacteria bacterium]